MTTKKPESPRDGLLTLEQVANQTGVTVAWLRSVLHATGYIGEFRAAALAALAQHHARLDVTYPIQSEDA